MKMKTQFAYLYVILPLFIIGLYQQINQNDPTHHVKTAYMKDDFVLLKISQSGYHKITKNRLETRLSNIGNIEDAVIFLKNNLEQAKSKQDSAYAGFAIEGYARLRKELQNKPEVLLAYANLLSFTHQFELSSEALEKLSYYPRFYESAIIELLNIRMLKGDLVGVKEQCLRTKIFKDYRMFIACQTWLKGMRSEEHKLIIKSSSRLLKLSSLGEGYSDVGSVRNWLLQLSLELYLKSSSVLDAQQVLKKIFQSNMNDDFDLAPLILMIDYLILNQKFNLASELLIQYDEQNQLKVRRLLIERNLNMALFFESNNLYDYEDYEDYARSSSVIQSYIMTQDESKYRLVALWFLYMKDDVEKSQYYAELNQLEYTTFIDLMLLSKVSKLLSNVNNKQSLQSQSDKL